MKIRRRPRGDDGATLLIALIIITTVALVMGSVLSQTYTSVSTTVALRDQAGSAYNGDGAAQAAVNQLRNGSYNNADDGTACFGASGSLPLSNFYPATNGQNGGAASSADVECTPEPGTGAQGSPVPITSQNKPGNAILTLGQNPAEDGVHIKPLNNTNPFRVHGSIVSDSNIVVTQGSMVTNAGVFAHTGCSGSITSSPAPSCSAGTVADPNYQFEPAYGSPANAVPVYQPVPTTCPGGIVTFSAGYYDDADALSTLMKGNGTCKGSVWWFQPGTYYFDFHNNPADPSFDPVLGSWSGGDTWTVNDGTLLAGTPVDPAGNPIAAPPKSPSVPGACQNPIDSTSALGVQFIFGGDSQLVVNGSANAEICGSYHSNRPPIAVYGLKSGTDSTTVLTGANTLKTTSVAAGSFGSASVAKLADADGSYATWTNPSGTKTGTITLSGYPPAQPVPAGSVLKAAVLRVVHREPASSANPSNVQVTITPNGGSALAATPLTVSPAGWKTDSINVTSALAPVVHSTGLTSASMLFSASMRGSGSEDLDTIQLDLTYIAPAFRGETTTSIPGNCLTATYTGGSSGQCAVLSTPTNYAGAFFVQGTTNTPAAAIDLTLNNLTSQVLRFGVVARSLWVKETGSLNYSGPVIEVPDNSPGYGTASTIVDLQVYVCPGSSACSSSAGKLQLTARVQIWDPSGSPVPGARQITVLSWSQQR
jgi:hypothetical protein